MKIQVLPRSKKQFLLTFVLLGAVLVVLIKMIVNFYSYASSAGPKKEGYVKLYELKRIPEAIAEARRALAEAEQKHGASSTRLTPYLDALARMLDEQKKPSEAEPYAARALEIREKAYGPKDPRLLEALNRRAGIFIEQERYEEAEPLCRRAVEIAGRILGQISDDVPTALHQQGLVLVHQDKLLAAEPLFRRAILFREQILGSMKDADYAVLAPLLESLAGVLNKTSREAEAKKLEERAAKLREKERTIPVTPSKD